MVIVRVAAVIVAVALLLWGVLVISLRTQFSPVLSAIRRMNRRLVNPRALRTAGRPGSAASVIRHIGRSTGAAYRTPIGVVDVGDSFVVFLPYGTSPDWLKNVLAAGSAELETEGRTLGVDAPEIVGAEAVGTVLSTKDRRVARLYGVNQFLVLHRAEADVAPPR